MADFSGPGVGGPVKGTETAEGLGGASSLPSSTLGTFNRSIKEAEGSGRSSQTWAVVGKTECDEVRESRSTGCYMAPSKSGDADGVPIRRKVHRGDHPRPKVSTHWSS